MTTYFCEQPTLSDKPCDNPVSFGSKVCSAGHQIPSSRWTSTQASQTPNSYAVDSGSLDFEEVVVGKLPKKGWYVDPENDTQTRYWDGKQWTEDTTEIGYESYPPYFPLSL